MTAHVRFDPAPSRLDPRVGDAPHDAFCEGQDRDRPFSHLGRAPSSSTYTNFFAVGSGIQCAYTRSVIAGSCVRATAGICCSRMPSRSAGWGFGRLSGSR